MDRFNDYVVYKNDNGCEVTCIFFKGINTITSVPVERLEWLSDENEVGSECSHHLTLQEIGDQVKALRLEEELCSEEDRIGVIYVWVETPLEGHIYQTGNNSGDDSWVLYGTTRGYA